jgi:hypothetical protein
MLKLRVSLLSTALILTAVSAHAGPASTPCQALANLTLPSTKITLAETVAAGTFTLPPSPQPPIGPAPNFKDLPGFCHVVAEAAPTPDSDIKIEVWMPASGWNHRYRGQGNGGFAGVIDYNGMAAQVKRGYATAGTDTGHSASGIDAAWALGHPEKVADYGYRGIHEMTVKAKAIIGAFYGGGPDRSYFASCSDGGREALMEAQRFPADYDGILAGAPANYCTHLLTAAMWDMQATALDPAGYIPANKIPALSAAVLKACDARDGVTDGIVNDPRRCDFDPATLLCQGADSAGCLSAPQVAALKKLYAGPQDSSGRRIFPGYPPGGEDGPGGWPLWVTGPEPGRSLMFFFGAGYFTNMVYEKSGWDPKSFKLEDSLKLAETKTAHMLDATNPDLRPLMTRGGKLILYHGWSDAAIPATNTIDYYGAVASKLGRREVNSFVRLYMAPGMQHCSGGPGPHSFGQDGAPVPDDPEHNVFTALQQWVEKGSAPSSIVATKYNDDSDPAKGVSMTRPLCPYPQMAKYKGSGDTNDAANFVCRAEVK